MKQASLHRSLFLILILFGILLAACQPTPASRTEVPLAPSATATPTPPSTLTESEVPSPSLAMATSRGPDLVASDPAAVAIGSGHPVLIEFFRFT